jgi:hypothetical protein
MSTAHTLGKLKIIEVTDPKIISIWHIQAGDEQLHFFPYTREYSEDRTQSGFVLDHEKMAKMQRIVSSVNALDGLPQETLDGGWTGVGMSAYAKKLEGEKAELIKALEALVDYDSHDTEYDGRMIRICPSCGGQDGIHHQECDFETARSVIASIKATGAA